MAKYPEMFYMEVFTVFIVSPLRVATVRCIMACKITAKLHKWSSVQPFDSQHVQILNEMLNFPNKKRQQLLITITMCCLSALTIKCGGCI